MKHIACLTFVGALLLAGCAVAPTDAQTENANQGSGGLTTSDRLARLESDVTLIMNDLTVIRRIVEAGGGLAAPNSQPNQGSAPTRLDKEQRRSAPQKQQNRAPLGLEARATQSGQSAQQATGSLPAKPKLRSGWRDAVNPGIGIKSSGMALKENSLVLHLASYKSQDNAQAARILLQADYASELRGLDVIVRPSMVEGKSFYRLLAAPAGNQKKGEAVCDALRNKGAYCVVTSLEDESAAP